MEIYEVVNIHPEMPEKERETLKNDIADDIIRLLIRAKDEGWVYTSRAD